MVKWSSWLQCGWINITFLRSRGVDKEYVKALQL